MTQSEGDCTTADYTGGILRRMPNDPRTPQHTLRVTREEWAHWASLAHPRHVSDVIREQMRLWAKREEKKQQQQQGGLE